MEVVVLMRDMRTCCQMFAFRTSVLSRNWALLHEAGFPSWCPWGMAAPKGTNWRRAQSHGVVQDLAGQKHAPTKGSAWPCCKPLGPTDSGHRQFWSTDRKIFWIDRLACCRFGGEADLHFARSAFAAGLCWTLTQRLLERLFDGIDTVATNFIGIHGLLDDGEQIGDVGLLGLGLLSQRVGMPLQDGVGLFEIGCRGFVVCHGFGPVDQMASG